MVSNSLLAALLATSVLSASCGKKSKKGNDSSGTTVVAAVTDAAEDSLLSSSVSTGALAITNLDVLGVASSSGASLRLAGSDYDNDKARTNVHDAAMDALTQAASILCFFNQANYIEMVGKGPYLAQADMETCFNEGGGADEEGQSSGSQKKLLTLTVESIRESDRHPLIVKAWFGMKEEKEVKVQLKLVVAEGQSVQNPLGIFKLAWDGKAEGQPKMKGYIEARRSSESGKIILNMAESNNEEDGRVYITAGSSELSYDAEAEKITGGVIHSQMPNWSKNDVTVQEYAASFNETRYLRKNVSANEEQCLAKDEFEHSVWRYGVYDASSGSRINRNSGFPIQYEANGQQQYGWAGYWGLWFGQESETTDGMLVHRVDNATGTKTNYTVRVGAGKLIKKTKKTATLDSLAGVEMDVHSPEGAIVVAYDAASKTFKKVGIRNNMNQVEAASGTYELMNAWQDGQTASNWFWSQSLGGQVIVYSDAAGQAVGDALYYTEENVTATAGTLNLYCYQNCLKANITKAQAEANQWQMDGDSAFYSFNHDDPTNPSNQHAYTYSSTDMALKLGGQSVTLAADVSDISGQNSWGLRSGPMLTSAVSNPYEVHQASEYYEWETGPHAHNRFTALIDSNGAAVSFEAPLFIKYVHTAANDRSGASSSKYFDKPYLLDYNGFGNLNGIPSGPNADGMYQSFFALKDGTLIGDANQYKVKALDEQLTLKEKAGECASLSFGTLPELPSIDAWKAPNLGDQPSLSSAPAVVEGVVQ